MVLRLEPGARGAIGGQGYRVLARLTFRTEDGAIWDEYLLADGRLRRWLTLEPDHGHAFIWNEVRRPGLAKPDELEQGQAFIVQELEYRIDERDTKSLVEIDGSPEDREETGMTVRYAEGAERRDSGGFRIAVESWGSAPPELYIGTPMPLDTVRNWSKPPPRAPRPRSVVHKEAAEQSSVAFFIALPIFAFVLMIDGCWHDNECRFYREDGTSYTARCSHVDHTSVRSESTGRRLSGFGK